MHFYHWASEARKDGGMWRENDGRTDRTPINLSHMGSEAPYTATRSIS